jgi:hypothetical protein
MQVSQFVFGITSFIVEPKVGMEFIQESFPVIKPFQRLIGISRDTGLKPFLSNILKVGQRKGNLLRIILKI